MVEDSPSWPARSIIVERRTPSHVCFWSWRRCGPRRTSRLRKPHGRCREDQADRIQDTRAGRALDEPRGFARLGVEKGIVDSVLRQPQQLAIPSLRFWSHWRWRMRRPRNWLLCTCPAQRCAGRAAASWRRQALAACPAHSSRSPRMRGSDSRSTRRRASRETRGDDLSVLRWFGHDCWVPGDSSVETIAGIIAAMAIGAYQYQDHSGPRYPSYRLQRGRRPGLRPSWIRAHHAGQPVCGYGACPLQAVASCSTQFTSSKRASTSRLFSCRFWRALATQYRRARLSCACA